MAGESPLSFGTTTSLSATTSTGNAALPTLTSNQVAVTNLGPDLAYVKFGTDNTVTATTAAYPLLPGTQITFTIGPSLTYGAAICPTSTATIKFTAADGYISGVAAASTGASGGTVDSVNVAQWGGTATTLGQKTMAASVPVVLASDESNVPTNLAQVAGATVATGHGVAATALRVELPTDGTGVVGLNAGSAIIGNIRIDQTTPGTTNGVVVNSGTLTTLTGTTTLTPGTGATNLGKAEDAVHTSGDTGVFALGVSTDGSTALNAAGDYGVIGTDIAGNVHVIGTVAKGAAISGNPVRVGGNGSNTAPSAVSAGQTQDVWLGLNGNVMVGTLGQIASDAQSNTLGWLVGSDGTARQTTTAPYLYNGSTWDRVRSGGVTGMVGVNPQATASGAASFLNIAAGQATTTVKSGAGTVYAIILNSAATATNTTTVYDNTAASGTVIARPAATTATVPTTLNYGPTGLAFATGLTIITATANGSDMTVVYK